MNPSPFPPTVKTDTAIGWRSVPVNGTLTHDAEHGWTWTTNCRKCSTQQRVRLGAISLVNAQAAVQQLATTPMECPMGFHMELGGWDQLWSLDLMLARYANELPV